MYLFDTDVISNLFKPKPSRNLLAKLRTVSQQDQYISTITVSEIVYGAVRSARADYHLMILQDKLLPSINIAGFDTKAAFICGRIRAKLEMQGQPLPLADLEIASIAISNEFTLITGNTKHFQRINELDLENWL